MRCLTLVALIAACSSSEPPREHVQLGPLTFDVPADWSRVEANRRGVSTAIWSPPENVRKETLTVTRSLLVPVTAQAGPLVLQEQLARANTLPGAKRSGVEFFVSQQGLNGARVELDYVPPNSSERYHRIHAVLVDGDALVHVLYTARDPDTELAALQLVLATIRHEEA